MPTQPSLIARIISDLKIVVAHHAARNPALTALLVLAWHRLHRISQRFESLLQRWRDGTLRPTRPARPGRTATRRPSVPRIHLTRNLVEANVYASQLQYNLADPEIARFLAEVPRAGRILRPLWRMMALELPDILRLPPRPPRPARPRAKPPGPPPTPRRALRPLGISRYRPRRKFSAA